MQEQRSTRESWVCLVLPVALILGLVLLLNLNTGQSTQTVELSQLETWLRLIAGYRAVGAKSWRG